jgi:hypothetical protein
MQHANAYSSRLRELDFNTHHGDDGVHYVCRSVNSGDNFSKATPKPWCGDFCASCEVDTGVKRTWMRQTNPSPRRAYASSSGGLGTHAKGFSCQRDAHVSSRQCPVNPSVRGTDVGDVVGRVAQMAKSAGIVFRTAMRYVLYGPHMPTSRDPWSSPPARPLAFQPLSQEPASCRSH